MMRPGTDALYDNFKLNTAVAFFVFNRPSLTRIVFEQIRNARPPKLFIIADGPREQYSEDAFKCEETRKVVEYVDWPCQVFRLYSDINLGCGGRPASGITWIFDHVEEAILLEDDCLPHPTFFRYCEELLGRYKSDTRIMAICGTNFQFRRKRSPNSYYYSKFVHCTGWATWSRAWCYFDHDLKLFPEISSNGWLEAIIPDKKERVYWSERFQQAAANKREIWDYQWTFAMWIQSAMAIIPEVNLISNIGYNKDGTHTKNDKDLLANLPIGAMSFPLKHPNFMIHNHTADRFVTDIAFIHSKAHAIKFIIKKWMLDKEKRCCEGNAF